ncbi:MAG: hypothetical protein LBV18_03420 [Alistipes sp.]|nr:hypothetical protein [Alistipes sp.]
MNKFVCLLTLPALFIGCSDTKPNVECDAGYTMEFYVENGTNKEVVVSNNTLHDAISPGGRFMVDDSFSLGPCDNNVLMTDRFPDDYRIGAAKYNFSMTIDGEDISDEIWLRKHWSFTPGYYSWTYTLVVTDELLAELAAAE